MLSKGPLERFVENQEFELAKAFIKKQQERGSLNYEDGENMIYEVLRGEHPERVPQDLVDLVLQVFLEKRSDRKHGSWVHSLSHITEKLWELRQIDWIKKFNQVAFGGATKTKDSSCCDRLIRDFIRYANWDDKLEDVALIPENLAWVNKDEIEDYDLARLAAGNFDSESAYLRWKLSEPSSWSFFRIVEIQSNIARLVELGEDVDVFIASEKEFLKKELKKTEEKLAKAEYDWQIENLRKDIEEIQEKLKVLA